MKLYEHILNGSIHIERNFLENKLYNKMSKEISKLKYKAHYQPSTKYFGNRFQAYPVNELDYWNKYKDILVKKIENLLECKIENVHIFLRKMITKELLKSKTNTPYGIIHHDPTNQFAGVMPFYQSNSGGTAFFEYEFDKYPDIQIGAYPNRLIIYGAKRTHAACNDFSFKETYKLNIFFDKV
jgi:hypothetical protein